MGTNAHSNIGEVKNMANMVPKILSRQVSSTAC